MRVEKTFETPEGSVTFIGELAPEEMDLVLSVGLNYLLKNGALPLKAMQNVASAVAGSDSLQ